MRTWRIAFITIALTTLTNWAGAQVVYKCGATYSQLPCPDAETLQVNDDRSSEQQQQTRQATRRDQQQAEQLAKARTHPDKAAGARTPTSHPAANKKTKPVQTTSTAAPVKPVANNTAVPIAKLASKPVQFVAQIPESAAAKGKKKKPSTVDNKD
ncbi:MAG: hypothetical protein KBG00_11095 [Rhodoferax sp.]|jgi:flagellum-specific peptidoglycan hydrolase FlgJ|nr:hypothetical protein [Rhodoferax sp.]